MHIDKIKVGDAVYVKDWSYTVNVNNISRMYLSYTPWVNEPHIVIAKGKFPGLAETGRILFNNLHLKNIKSGDEFYIKSRFVRKVRKERTCQKKKE